jgi:hypothetical protein
MTAAFPVYLASNTMLDRVTVTGSRVESDELHPAATTLPSPDGAIHS